MKREKEKMCNQSYAERKQNDKYQPALQLDIRGAGRQMGGGYRWRKIRGRRKGDL